jgi:hypothetical protein
MPEGPSRRLSGWTGPTGAIVEKLQDARDFGFVSQSGESYKWLVLAIARKYFSDWRRWSPAGGALRAVPAMFFLPTGRANRIDACAMGFCSSG